MMVSSWKKAALDVEHARPLRSGRESDLSLMSVGRARNLTTIRDDHGSVQTSAALHIESLPPSVGISSVGRGEPRIFKSSPVVAYKSPRQPAGRLFELSTTNCLRSITSPALVTKRPSTVPV